MRLVQLIKPLVDRFPRVGLVSRFVRDGWALSRPSSEVLHGFRLVGNELMESGQFEPEETSLVQDLLPKVDLLVNIGANIGYYCCIALKAGKEVVAFEPLDSNLRYLLRNLRENNWRERVEVYPVAVGNKDGIVDLFGAGTGASLLKGWAGAPEFVVTSVPLFRLDTLLGQRFQGRQCFILVDIEGSEKGLLEGASGILGMDPKPIWMMEIAVSEHQPAGVKINPNLLSTFDTFWANGYESWTATKVSRPVVRDEIERIASGAVNTLPTNNFFFIEAGNRTKFFGD
jgi:FkbM family methyltransferase